jgi:hypothetical protein
MKPRLIQTFLLDGTLEGVRVIEVTGSAIKAFVIPRIKLQDIKNRPEIHQPALYLLINTSDNQLYIGESEDLLYRIKNHDQSKDFWDIVIAIVSTTNQLEKSDIKYLESLSVERAKESAAMEVLNKTVPSMNNIHEFKIHILQSILDDTAVIAEFLGFSIFAKKHTDQSAYWFCQSKKTEAKAEFRGDKFIVLSGSIVDKTVAPSWANAWPKALAERNDILTKYGKDCGDVVELIENVPFKSPNHAGGFLAGRSINAWITFVNKDGKTMDEIMRRGL